jgi:hypothetical protein
MTWTQDFSPNKPRTVIFTSRRLNAPFSPIPTAPTKFPMF